MYKDITVDELAKWKAAGKDFTLLDVREAVEVAAAAIDGATHIPMGQIVHRASELDKSAEIAVLCHHGGRSARVAQFLAGQGFGSVYNIDGGIDAYAAHVDPSIPRY